VIVDVEKNKDMNLKKILIISLGCCLFVVFLVVLPKAISLGTKTASGENKVSINWEERLSMSAHQFWGENTLTDNDPFQEIASNNTYYMKSEVLTPAYPLKISANGRYLEDQNDQPVFWSGDTAWSLIVQGTVEDIDVYLANRQQKGVNVILVNLIDHRFGTYAPSNIYGDPPFTSIPFTTPNEAYFAHADYAISSAAEKGMAVLLDPLYLGYACGSEGWCAEVQAASIADMQSWGQYVGNRYVNFDNIVWVIGGDTDPTVNGVEGKVTAFVNGLLSFDTHHLITAHNAPGQMAVTPWDGASWLTLNDTYTSFLGSYQLAQTAYQISPAMPFFQIEAYYENDSHSMTNQKLRAQAYWTVLSGGMGYIFGNCPVWGLGSPAMSFCPDADPDWIAQLDYPGAFYMMFVQYLFSTRPWQILVPDFAHTFITTGYGSYGETDYAAAEVTADGRLALAYLPTIRTVTVDLTRMSSEVNASWYDPTNGLYTIIEGSPFPNNGSYQFTPPDNNADGDSDWMIVFESVHVPTPTPTETQEPKWIMKYLPIIEN